MKVNKEFYCLKCKKELETQDENEECFYSNHQVRIKLIIEVIEGEFL